MRVVIFGATGMIGRGVLLEALDAATVADVLVVGRNACGILHPKLREHLVRDLFDIASYSADFAGKDACFFCLGVSAVGMSEADYTHLTYDLTVAVASAFHSASPDSTFIYVTGQGTDSTERGRSMWARVKGKTENALLGMGFKGAYMFRPGFIQPMRGVRSRTAWYQAVYNIIGPLAPLVRSVAPNAMTTTESVGRAMLSVATRGYAKTILATADINAAAKGATS